MTRQDRHQTLRESFGMLGLIILAAVGAWWLAVGFVVLHFIGKYW